MSSKEVFIFSESTREFFEERLQHGFHKKNIKIYPAVHKYLVDLLESYLLAKNFVNFQEMTLAELYLKATNSQEQLEKQDLLKTLGDHSLYVSGFFADHLSKKVVDIEYYANIGGAAYSFLASSVRADTLAKVYDTISQKFLEIADVFSYVGQESISNNDQAILKLYDRYLLTGSQSAREKLHELGVVTVPADQTKTKQN